MRRRFVTNGGSISGPDGSVRLPRVSFAACFDVTMRRRHGMPRQHAEADVRARRPASAAMFAELRRRKGVRSYLAHNMTVTSENLGQVPEMAREVAWIGY
mgnify:CR=1 FL=1